MRSITVEETIDGPLTTVPWSWNGQDGLDMLYPYGWTQGAPNYATSDSPGTNLTHYNAQAATLSDKFEDYIMYFPPGSSQCVPLAYFVWSTNGNADIPSTGYWASYGAGSAGPVTPQRRNHFLAGQLFPNVDADHYR